MFEINDKVQLTQDSCEYYEDADPSLYDLCGIVLTVTAMTDDSAGEMLCDVEDEYGEGFVFYGFELEHA